MHILLIGSGGREHALAWKIAQSPLVRRLTCAPGNPGTATVAANVALPDDVPAFARREAVDLVVVGPEQPLADGLADELAAAGIACFGPSRAAARLEASKSFVKELCSDVGIPTAHARAFEDEAAAHDYLAGLPPPHVVKADGLAAGKGVVIADDLEGARAAVSDMLGGRFGAASARVVIEEHMSGPEVSVFALTDGETVLPFGTARDYKRANEGDEGPNTGGMGAVSPPPGVSAETEKRIYAEVIRPALAAMRERGTPYVGVLYAGLMLTATGPRLIEFNCRFGDPECQLLMRRVRSDIVPALWGAATGRLSGIGLDWKPEAAALVVMAARGYPGDYEKGSVIGGIDQAERAGAVVFHAGTATQDDRIVANGGRVLNVTAMGADVGAARSAAYEGVSKIDWPGGFYRSDIGT